MGGARATAIQADPDAPPAALVGAQWLDEHLGDPNVRIVEVDVSPAAYNEWHIDGAVLWNVYADLKDGDYRLVDEASIGRLFAGSGIAPDSTVVFYGYAPALGVWLMRLYGHGDARVLDCRKGTWRDDGRPWTNEVRPPATTHYPLAGENSGIRAHTGEVEAAIADPGRTIVDVRSGPEFRGERFWPSGGSEAGGRAGHVPSALHLPIDDLYDERGSFRNATELRQLFAPVDPDGHDELICYCTIGGRASTAWFVLSQLLGRTNVRVYDGSWAEWGRLPTTPVSREPDRVDAKSNP